MHIRDYRPADAGALVAIFRAAVLEGSAPHYSAEQRKAWASRINDAATVHDRVSGQTCLVAEEDAGLSGFTVLRTDGHLDMLFILPSRRRSPIAGALHDAILDRARLAGHKRLSVHASDLARSFLAKRGWSFVRTETVTLHAVKLEHHYMTLQLTRITG